MTIDGVISKFGYNPHSILKVLRRKTAQCNFLGRVLQACFCCWRKPNIAHKELVSLREQQPQTRIKPSFLHAKTDIIVNTNMANWFLLWLVANSNILVFKYCYGYNSVLNMADTDQPK